MILRDFLALERCRPRPARGASLKDLIDVEVVGRQFFVLSDMRSQGWELDAEGICADRDGVVMRVIYRAFRRKRDSGGGVDGLQVTSEIALSQVRDRAVLPPDLDAAEPGCGRAG